MFKAFFQILTALVVITAASGTRAETGGITEDMIRNQYAKLEKALNGHGNIQGAIKALHDYLSEDAKFLMTVTNPLAGNGGKSPVLEMNKQDYINTYVQGTHHVAGYSIEISTGGFEYDAAAKSAVTRDVLTERGVIPGSGRNERSFVSRTTCRTSHELREGNLVATGSACHTDISFEEEV